MATVYSMFIERYNGTDYDTAYPVTSLPVSGINNTGTTVFNVDGSITQTFPLGTLTTVFTSDTLITETFVSIHGETIVKTTTFNPDGSITEAIATP